MTTLGLLLAVLGAASWATLDVLRKSIGEHVSASAAVAAMTLFQLPFLAAMLGVGELVDISAQPWATFFQGLGDMGARYAAVLFGTVALNLLAGWLFLRAVQLSPLGLTIPYLSFTPVFTSLSAVMFLGERPTVLGAIGIVVVTGAAFALNPGDDEERGVLAPLRAIWNERGSLYMVGVALIWSITPILDKVGSQQAGVVGHSAFVAAGIFALIAVARAIRDRGARRLVGELSTKPALLLAAAFFNVLGMVFQLSAYEFMDVAYVETFKRAIGVLTAVIVGTAVFGEGDATRRLVAAAVMAVGVTLVILA